jgi:glycosyltransferase involved in cell wall biosynthesis
MIKATSTIKVLHCRSSAGQHGPERALLELAPALERLGVKVEIVALYRRQRLGPAQHPWVAEVERAGLPVTQIPDPSAFSPRVARRLAWAMRRTEADLLHTHDYKSNVLGGLVARQADRSMPWVATVHLHTTTTRRLKVYRALDLFLLRLADRVVTVSRDQRRLLLSRGVERRRIALVPNVIDADAFAARAAPSAETRSRLGVPEGAPVLAVVGRLTPQKGVDVLLDALPDVLSVSNDLVVWVVGSGAARTDLEARAADSGVADRVTFLGYHQDAASLLAAADVVVVPSRAEGLPVVLLEAMSLGRPVVASRVGGVPDLINGPDVGWLVPPDNAPPLAAALREVLASPERRSAVGEAGRRRVKVSFAPERAARRLATVYRTVLAERS